MENAKQWLKDRIASVADWIPKWIKDRLGIHSPSRVMAKQVGPFIPAGIAKGVEDGAPALYDSVTQMADMAARKARSTVVAMRIGASVSADGPSSQGGHPGKGAPAFAQEVNITNYGVSNPFVEGTILGRQLAAAAMQTVRSQ